MGSSTDVLVIGGGGVGAACALYLAREGRSVTLLERDPEIASACSYGNAGIISPSHDVPFANRRDLIAGLKWSLKGDSPFSLKLRPGLVPWLFHYVRACRASQVHVSAGFRLKFTLAGLGEHARLAEQGIDTGFDHGGVMMVYRTEEGFARAQREAQRHVHHGLCAETLTASEARRMQPALGDATAGALFYRDEAHCDPGKFVTSVRAAAVQAGAKVQLGHEVLGLRRRGSRVVAVDTTAGVVYPNEVVVAAGVWSGRLLRQIGIYLPVEGGKGYHVDLEPAAGDPTLPILLREAFIGVVPIVGRALRLVGTFQLTGFDTTIEWSRVGAILAAATEGLPALKPGRVKELWRGLRPCTPDGVPAIGRTQALENVVVATGHGTGGIEQAPITGRLVAEIIGARQPSLDLTLLNPERFDKGRGTVSGVRLPVQVSKSSRQALQAWFSDSAAAE